MKKLLIILIFLMLPTPTTAINRYTIIIMSTTLIGGAVGGGFYAKQQLSDNKPINKIHLAGSILLGIGCGILSGGMLVHIIKVISEKKPDYSADIQAIEERIKREWTTRDQEIKKKTKEDKKLLKEQQKKEIDQNKRDLQVAAINLRTSMTERDVTKQTAAQENLLHIPSYAQLANTHEEALKEVDKETENLLLKNNHAFSEKMELLDPNVSNEEREVRFAEIDRKYGLNQILNFQH